jgi:hypothetical protein
MFFRMGRAGCHPHGGRHIFETSYIHTNPNTFYNGGDSEIIL